MFILRNWCLIFLIIEEHLHVTFDCLNLSFVALISKNCLWLKKKYFLVILRVSHLSVWVMNYLKYLQWSLLNELLILEHYCLVVLWSCLGMIYNYGHWWIHSRGYAGNCLHKISFYMINIIIFIFDSIKKLVFPNKIIIF